MSRGQRAAFILGPIAVVAVIVFLALQRGDDEAEPAAAPATQVAATTAATAQGETATEPSPVSIRVEGGQPVGGPAQIDVRKDDVVRFVVTADVADEVHVHGYDLSKSVGPGQRAAFQFRAEIEGIFEIELEGLGIEIASLVVQPR